MSSSQKPDLREYLAWARTLAHARKVESARVEIERASSLGVCAVATSWGKDSVALCDLTLGTVGRVPLVRRRSAYEMPGYELVIEHFRPRAEIVEVEDGRSLGEVVEWLRAHGFDFEQEVGHASTKIAKRDAVVTWMRERGVRVELLGMRADESQARRKCFRVRGLTYEAHGLVVSNPLGWWSSRDVWAYIASRELPYLPMYDRETHGLTRCTIRNAGWLTIPGAADQARLAWLRAHYPEQWRALVGEFPRLRMMS